MRGGDARGLSIFYPVESRLITWLPIGFYDFLGSQIKEADCGRAFHG